MRPTFILTIILWLGLALSGFAQAATLSSSVDRNAITQNETLSLTITYDDIVSATLLDKTELQNDFEIISSSPRVSNSTTIINGRTTNTATTTWLITLAPLREGNLVIPAFVINGDSSQAITIKVSAASAASKKNQPIEVSVTSNRKEVYPGQQIIISIRLSAINTASNLQGDPFTVAGADSYQLSQQQSQEVDNGITRQVFDLKYAVYPEQAGDLTIPVQSFGGIIGGRRSLFDNFGGGKRVGARSQALTITVKPKPAMQGHAWFPAERVSIISQWSADTTKMRVGEPITRSITIQAQGQRASAIPPLSFKDTDAYKSYSDKAQLENKQNANGLIGIREESVAIIPANSGKLTLPEQRIHWWNTNTKQWQQATLAAETVTVLPSLSPNTSATINPLPVSSSAKDSSVQNQDSGTLAYWKIATLLLTLLSALQFFLLYKQRNAVPKPASKVNDTQQQGEKQAWKALQTALDSKNAQKTRQQLLNWATTCQSTQKVSNLQSLAKLSTDTQVSETLQALDRHLYKNEEGINWAQLKDTLARFRKELNMPKSQDDEHALEPLYPS